MIVLSSKIADQSSHTAFAVSSASGDRAPAPQRAAIDLAVVVPTLREAGNLPALLTRVRLALDQTPLSWEVLVVDDDSCDGTAEVIADLSREDPRIRLLVRKKERGLAGAVLHGWRHTEAPILGVLDADLQHPPEALPDLVAAILSGSDMAIGSRYAKGGSVAGWHPLRRMVSALSILLIRPLRYAGLWASDPVSGFFLVRRRCIERVRFQGSGFKLLLQILVRSRARSVREVPICFGQRSAGSSKAGLGVALDYLRLLGGLYLEKCMRAIPPNRTRAR